jgi:glycosyltransferase involved in cell wall biosynthesis
LKRKIAIIHHLIKRIFFKELPFYSAILGWLSEMMIPILYKKTKFVTVSESSKRELEEFGIADIEVVYNGVDMVQSGNLGKNLRPAIIFLGRLKRYKRIDLLIKAYKIVSERVPETELLIVGDGDQRKELEQLAEETMIKADFFGYVDEATKAKLLREAWVFVITSEKEGWGVTVIEANACETPCVAFDVQGLRDSIIDDVTGILVRADGNVDNLAEAIIRVLEDDELREKLSKNALQYAKRFSWDIGAEMFLKAIER